MRPNTKKFVEIMNKRLDENSHKDGKLDDSPEALFGCLCEAMLKLRKTLNDHPGALPAVVGAAAADVGNFAAMIAESRGALVEEFDVREMLDELREMGRYGYSYDPVNSVIGGWQVRVTLRTCAVDFGLCPTHWRYVGRGVNEVRGPLNTWREGLKQWEEAYAR